MKNSIVIFVISLLIIGATGFFAGMKYQQSKQPSMADFQARRGMREGFSQNLPGDQSRSGSQAVRGEIINKDQDSIIVKLADESSKIVLISENTIINKASEALIDDLETGEQVMVFGQANSDGSVTAQNIQVGLNFALRDFPL